MRFNRRSIYLTKSEQQGGKMLCFIPQRIKYFVRFLPAAQEGLCNVAPGKTLFVSVNTTQTPEPPADCVNTAII